MAKKAVAYSLDGVLRDLSDPLAGSGMVEIVTRDDPRALELILGDAVIAQRLGDAGYERVRQNYLSISALEHWAELVRLLFGVERPLTAAAADATHAA